MVLLVDQKSTKTCLHAAAHTKREERVGCVCVGGAKMKKVKRKGKKNRKQRKKKEEKRKKDEMPCINVEGYRQHVVELKSSILIPAFLLHLVVGYDVQVTSEILFIVPFPSPCKSLVQGDELPVYWVCFEERTCISTTFDDDVVSPFL